MGCSDQILPHIKHTVDPAEMWDFLDDGFDNTLSKLGRTQILREFHACHPGIDEKMNTYFNRLIDYRNQLSGSAEEISEDSFVTHIFTHIPKEFATTINIFERQAPPPTSQYIMDAIRLDKEKVSFVTEIAEASAGAALYSQRGGYCGCGCGGSGRFGRRKTYRLTYRKMDLQTTETCGKQKRAQSGNGNSVRNGNSGGNDCPGGDNAGGSDEKACYHGGIPGHIRPDCIHYKRAKETRNTVRKGTASIDTAGDRDPL